MESVRFVEAMTRRRDEVVEPVELLAERGHEAGARLARLPGRQSRCSSESASASSRKTTPSPSSLATPRISWSSSPVFGPNFDVRFMSLR